MKIIFGYFYGDLGRFSLDLGDSNILVTLRNVYCEHTSVGQARTFKKSLLANVLKQVLVFSQCKFALFHVYSQIVDIRKKLY